MPKDPLKKLMRQFPAPDELKDQLDALRKADDRTMALVGASILEAMLERLIQGRLAFCNSTLAGQLFQNRGPLSDFYGKIIVAQACGYITEPMAGELLLVKSIRNAFAHAVVGISFNTPEVQKKMEDSTIIRILVSVPNVPEPPDEMVRGASAFALVVRILAVVLDARHQELGHAPLTERMAKPRPVDLPSDEISSTLT